MLVLFRASQEGIDNFVSVGFMGRCHNFVCGSLGPSSTVSPSIVTLHFFFVNVTSQPLSQNFLVAMREVCESFGTMCPDVMSSDSQGMSKLQVCVDLIVFPSGSVMLMGCFATLMFVTFASACMKCPVAPESDMPMVMFAGGVFSLLTCCALWSIDSLELQLLALIVASSSLEW